jgi:endonuclease/exonuclease/phosphatase family metal-dependent hydrolase
MAILGISRSVQGTDTVGLTARWRIWSWRRRIVQFAHLDGLRLINIHLSPQDVESLREHELARVLHRAARDRSNARLMAGDFNARPNAALFAALTAAGLRDAWVVARPDSANAGATHWSARDRGRRAPTRRIDYVWVSPDITIERADLPRYGSDGYEIYPKLSDHLPLTVTLDVE